MDEDLDSLLLSKQTELHRLRTLKNQSLQAQLLSLNEAFSAKASDFAELSEKFQELLVISSERQTRLDQLAKSQSALHLKNKDLFSNIETLKEENRNLREREKGRKEEEERKKEIEERRRDEENKRKEEEEERRKEEIKRKEETRKNEEEKRWREEEERRGEERRMREEERKKEEEERRREEEERRREIEEMRTVLDSWNKKKIKYKSKISLARSENKRLNALMDQKNQNLLILTEKQKSLLAQLSHIEGQFEQKQKEDEEMKRKADIERRKEQEDNKKKEDDIRRKEDDKRRLETAEKRRKEEDEEEGRRILRELERRLEEGRKRMIELEEENNLLMKEMIEMRGEKELNKRPSYNLQTVMSSKEFMQDPQSILNAMVALQNPIILKTIKENPHIHSICQNLMMNFVGGEGDKKEGKKVEGGGGKEYSELFPGDDGPVTPLKETLVSSDREKKYFEVIERMTEEMEEVRERVVRLNRENEDLRKEMLQKNQFLLEGERKWREMEEFRRELEEENMIKGRKVKILEEGIVTKEEKMGGFEKEIVRLSGVIGGLKKEIQEKNGRSRELEEERDQLLEISNQLTAQVRKFSVVPINNNHSERIEKWMKNIEQKIEALAKEITSFKANSFENKEILEEIQNKLTHVQNEVNNELKVECKRINLVRSPPKYAKNSEKAVNMKTIKRSKSGERKTGVNFNLNK